MEQHWMFPILTTRLRLRPLTAVDLDALLEIYLHPDVARWIGAHTRQDVEAEISQHIASQNDLGWSRWAVEDCATGRVIGDCGLQLGYDFHPDAWGRGIATEAAQAVMRQALGPLALERVVAVVKPDHVASQRVLAKAGLHSAGARLAYGERMLLYESSPLGRETASRGR
jgi:ribosomal-protein-alanine N-acetyltransferase